MNKWLVVCTQKTKYNETISAEFNTSAEAVMFAETLLRACVNIDIKITTSNIAPKEDEADE